MKLIRFVSIIATFVTFFAFLGSVGALETGLIDLRAGTIRCSLFLAAFCISLLFASKGDFYNER